MKEKRKLMEEIVCEGRPFRECEAASHRGALRAFRRQHLFRLIARVSSVAAGVAFAAALWHWPKGHDTPGPTLAGRSPAPPLVHAPDPAPIQDDGLPRVSDAELLAAFPPDSCFLAEVNGERILVFRDPELRKRYLE